MTEYLSVEEAAVLIADEWFEVADPGLLASAALRPQTTVFGKDAYPTDYVKAAALLESLARNHALVDGNERAAWLLTSVFLLQNGIELHVDHLAGADFVEQVAQGLIPLDESAQWLQDHAAAAPPDL